MYMHCINSERSTCAIINTQLNLMCIINLISAKQIARLKCNHIKRLFDNIISTRRTKVNKTSSEKFRKNCDINNEFKQADPRDTAAHASEYRSRCFPMPSSYFCCHKRH